MPRHASKLKSAELPNLGPGFHADGNNLYLSVKANGTRSWVFRYMMDGRRRDSGLGRYPNVTLTQARDAAQKEGQLVAQGIDPIEEKRKKSKKIAPTSERNFKTAASAHIKKQKPKWKNAKHSAQWHSSLQTYAFPKIGNMDVGDIELADILAILQPIWYEKTETASRVRSRIQASLQSAYKIHGIVRENPAAWKGNLEFILPHPDDVKDIQHHRAIEYSEAPKFWTRLMSRDGTGAKALQLLILTAARSVEIRFMTWNEVDLDERVWLLPPSRNKGSITHKVPLSDPAVEILRSLRANAITVFVFPGQPRKPRKLGDSPISDQTLSAVLKRMKVDAVPHGFRATFRTWSGEETDHQSDVCEFALAHKVKGKTAEAYQRGQLFRKRQALMNDWADFLQSDVRQKP